MMSAPSSMQRRQMLTGVVLQLDAHVERADNEIRILLLQRADPGHGLVLVGAVVAVSVVVLAVDAQPQPVRRRHDLRLVVFAEVDPVLFQRGPGVAFAGVVEVVRVVVGRRNEIDAALDENIGRCGGSAEIEGLYRTQPLVGEGAFQICDRILVVGEVLHGVGEGVAVIAVHFCLIVAGILMRGKRQVSDEGEDKALRLGFRGGLGRGLGRWLGGGVGRHMDRRRRRVGRGEGRGACRGRNGKPITRDGVKKTAAQQHQQGERDQRAQEY